jgi:hypothetical protein
MRDMMSLHIKFNCALNSTANGSVLLERATGFIAERGRLRFSEIVTSQFALTACKIFLMKRSFES